MSWQNRWEPRSSSQLQGQKMLSEGRVRRIYTHTLYILPAFMDVSLIPLFFRFFPFFLCIQTSFEASFRPEPLRKPPYETSRVDIQFYHNFKIIYTDIPLELPKDDQVLLLQGFNDVLSPKRDDGKRFSTTSENLKNGSPDQKSRCRTCAQACYSPFNRQLNPDKTKLLVTGTRQMLQKLPDFHITLLGKEIALTASARDLGVQINATNSWL